MIASFGVTSVQAMPSGYVMIICKPATGPSSVSRPPIVPFTSNSLPAATVSGASRPSATDCAGASSPTVTVTDEAGITKEYSPSASLVNSTGCPFAS